MAALNRLWQIDVDLKRRTLPRLETQRLHNLWLKSLDRAHLRLGEDAFWNAWQQLEQILSRSWCGSMLAECVNSLLRPMLDSRQHIVFQKSFVPHSPVREWDKTFLEIYTDQGCLALFRFFHNHRIFQRGKRAGSSPAQLAGIHPPDDPLLLLGLEPKC